MSSSLEKLAATLARKKARWAIIDAAILERQRIAREAKQESRKTKTAASPEAKRAAARAYHRIWRKANPDKVKAISHRRRAAECAAVGSHTAADIRDIYKNQRGRCAYCRSKLGKDYHVDHIKPLSKGGSNDRRNLQLTCPPCNLSKRTADPIEFAQRLGRLL